MTARLMQAAQALAELLAAENAALNAHDHLRATAMLERKQRLVGSFEAAQAAAPTLTGQDRDHAREVGCTLQALAVRNVALLEQAMEIQSRVISIVAAAARQQVRASAVPAGYGRKGAVPAASRPAAYAMVARA